MDALGLDQPVLVGHGRGGQLLSSIGSRLPEKVAGLIYLDAAYSYAYHDPSKGDYFIELNVLRRKLDQLNSMSRVQRPLIDELLETNLPEFERSLRRFQEWLNAAPPGASMPMPGYSPHMPAIQRAVWEGVQRYTDIRAPILAIFALVTVSGPEGSRERSADEAWNQTIEDQARAFEEGLPSARVVRLADARHFVFRTNEADVLRETEAFIASLPQPLDDTAAPLRTASIP
jgi:pimeloyl-ACP methyl ester carboxylesterase